MYPIRRRILVYGALIRSQKKPSQSGHDHLAPLPPLPLYLTLITEWLPSLFLIVTPRFSLMIARDGNCIELTRGGGVRDFGKAHSQIHPRYKFDFAFRPLLPKRPKNCGAQFQFQLLHRVGCSVTETLNSGKL